jgi:hypothetical protein
VDARLNPDMFGSVSALKRVLRILVREYGNNIASKAAADTLSVAHTSRLHHATKTTSVRS